MERDQHCLVDVALAGGEALAAKATALLGARGSRGLRVIRDIREHVIRARQQGLHPWILRDPIG